MNGRICGAENSSDRKFHPVGVKRYRSDGKYDLSGRVEIVALEQELRYLSAVGRVQDGEKVIVKYGNLSPNPRCLVRFDCSPRTTIGTFITANIPENFRSLKPEEYIFYALWEPSMDKGGKFPTIYEKDNFYDPGHTCWFVYCNEKEKVCIGHNSLREVSQEKFDYIIQNCLPDPLRASRLIISESEEELEEIVMAIRSADCFPIRLENLAALQEVYWANRTS